MQLLSLSLFLSLCTSWKHQKTSTEAVVWSCSVKKVFFKISQNSQENNCVSLFFNKTAYLRPETFHYSGTGVFLKILRKF